MNLFKKIHSHMYWPIHQAFLVYALIGYAIYCAARLTPIHPEWATALIELLKPLIGGLKTAERVSDHAFEVQMRTIYLFFGSMPLIVYTGYCFLFDAKIHNAAVAIHREKKTGRIKLFFAGVMMMLICLPLYYSLLMSDPTNSDGGRLSHYASGFSGTTFALLLTILPMWGMSALKALALSFSPPLMKPETNTKN